MNNRFTVLMTLSDEERNNIARQLESLWQGIGPDMLAACEEMGEKLTNDAVLQHLLDADRLETAIDEDRRSTSEFARARVAEDARVLTKFRLLSFEQQKRFLGKENLSFV